MNFSKAIKNIETSASVLSESDKKEREEIQKEIQSLYFEKAEPSNELVKKVVAFNQGKPESAKLAVTKNGKVYL